jgi:hypothetical protein
MVATVKCLLANEMGTSRAKTSFKKDAAGFDEV